MRKLGDEMPKQPRDVMAEWKALTKPEHRGLSAKELYERDPENALKQAEFLRANKAEIVAAISGKLMSQQDK